MGAATQELEVRDGSQNLVSGTMVGDYRIEATIGSGGMATVYQALQPVIGKRVALKVMHRAKSDTAIGRFVKEARAVNLIEHPNIVDVFNFGMTSNGRPYLVMELLIGETLAVRAKRSAMPVAETCEILIEVSHALEAAHEAGIVHRDLKPENVFLVKRKDLTIVKLLDFGIAKLFGDSDNDFGVEDTRPGILIGTPRYISPEQVRGNKLDGRVDIYALGVVAFELLTGRPPFTASSAVDLFQKHAKLKPPTPSAFNPALPAACDTLLAAMLAKDPAERPLLAEVRDQLATIREAPIAVETKRGAAQTTAVQPVAPPTAAGTTTHEHTDITTVPTVVRNTQTDRRWIWLAAIPAAIGVLLAFVIASSGGDDAVGTRPQARSLGSPPPPVTVQAPIITPPASPPTTPTMPPTTTTSSNDDAEGVIDIDPVTHVAKPVKRRIIHKRPPHPITTTPEKPADIDPTPPPSEDDAVRSPFDHTP